MEEPINICVTCLSTDRYLVPVNKITALLQEIHFEKLKESPGGVCWECWSVLAKFYRFKNRAKIAQETLLQSTQQNNIKSLTTLSKTYIQHYTFNFPTTDYDDNLKVDKDSIKEEFVDQSDSHTDNTSDTDEIPFEELENNRNINVEVKMARNEDNINWLGKQEQGSQDESNIFDNTNETSKAKPKKVLTKRTVKRHKKDVSVTKKISQKSFGDTDDKEFKEKFTQVILSDEEMIRVRERRRNHPSFRKLPHICHGCVLGFRKEVKYKIHMKKKHDERIGPLCCDICSIRFPHNLALNKHKRKHYVVYRCQLCKYEGNDLRSAVNHCKIKHIADTPNSIHCSQCHFVAKNPEDLEGHKEKEHRFWCNECGEKFTRKQSISIHMTRTHAPKRDFKCDICKKGFKTKMQLESHLARHNENIAKKLSYCAECNIQYKTIVGYRKHLENKANHSEGYPCSQCNKKFKAKSYLKQHFDFCHLRKSQYKCEVCNKTFISKSALNSHQAAHLGKSRPRKYSCNICSKKFFSSTMLRNHEMIHSDERLYMCEDCGDTFKQKACLYTHTRLKHRDGGRKRKRDG